MRDDLHNKAPIHVWLRRVLRHALRPADQQRPDMLRDLASVAMARELLVQMTRPLIVAIRDEESAPLLFHRLPRDPRVQSRLQADVFALKEHSPGRTVRSALEEAARRHIGSICNESEAAMLAAGGSKREVGPGVEAFKVALLSGLPAAITSCFEASSADLPDHRVTIDEVLPLALAARRTQ